ncbi:MAG: ATP-binding protein [Fimbriimonas sp.]|nr:ATP-binding protein [Fimbriimonas sp.]
MSHRLGLWAVRVCYVGAAVLAVLAVASFSRLLILQPGWGLLFAGALLGIAGTRAKSAIDASTEAAAERLSKVEMLKAQLEEQRNAVDDMADGLEIAIFICDAKGTIHYANKRAIELFRFDRPVGRTVLAVTLSNDLEQLVVSAGRSRSAQNAEISFTYPNEKVGLAKTWPTVEGGDRVFLSIYEITDLKRLERIRQDFVSNVSHELRTPLTIIRSMAETLLDDLADPSDRSGNYLSKIIAEVDRLTLISQDLLILSAAESNPVRKQICDIGEVYRSTVSQLEAKAHEKGLDISFDGPVTCLIEANASQMTQVALNLVDNALKYTTHGRISVTVRRDDSQVRIDVADTGIGIPSDQVNRIFERFYRVDRARSRSTGGTGLGLSIVKHITEAHGGAVTVESALNHGSTFTVQLPIGNLTLPLVE